MSSSIPTSYINQFSDNVRTLAQQMNSRLRSAVEVETMKGEFAFFDQVGVVEPVEITSRHASTPITEVPHSRRRLSARDFVHSEIVDYQDVSRVMSDPQGRYTKMFGYSMARRMDRTIMEAFFEDAFTGKSGGTGVSLPSGQKVAVDFVEVGTAVSSGMTLGKLRRARELLMDAEAGGGDDGDFYIAVTQREITSLIRTTELSSIDYNTVRALEKGDIDTFMGFKFIRLIPGLFQDDTNGNRRIPVWHKSGVIFAPLENPVTNAEKDPTVNFNVRVHMRASFGAVRMEEVKVVEIAASKTAI